MTRQTWSDIKVSAYIDGQLDAQERVAFESAMARSAELRQAVKSALAVKKMLRAAPLRETPRNYLLTPSMLAAKSTSSTRARPRMPLFAMRLATSATALLFVMTMVFNVSNRGFLPPMNDPAMNGGVGSTAMVADDDGYGEVSQTMSYSMSSSADLLADEPMGNSEPQNPVFAPDPDMERGFDAGEVNAEENPTLLVGQDSTAEVPAAPEMPTDGSGEGFSPAALSVPASPNEFPERSASEADVEDAMPEAEALVLPLSQVPANATEFSDLQKIAPPPADTYPPNNDSLTESVEMLSELPALDVNETWLPATTPKPSRPLTYWLAWGFGIATLILGILTFWVSRRR